MSKLGCCNNMQCRQQICVCGCHCVLQEQGIDQDQAQQLIDSFLDRFPGGLQHCSTAPQQLHGTV